MRIANPRRVAADHDLDIERWQAADPSGEHGAVRHEPWRGICPLCVLWGYVYWMSKAHVT